MIRTLGAQQGAGFIELLAAITVFAIVAIGLSPSLLSTRKVASLGKNQSIAATLAADKIEQIRGQTSGLITAGSDGPLNADGSSGGIFSRSWTITKNTPNPQLSRVVVTVSWRDRPGNHSITLVTLVPQ